MIKKQAMCLTPWLDDFANVRTLSVLFVQRSPLSVAPSLIRVRALSFVCMSSMARSIFALLLLGLVRSVVCDGAPQLKRAVNSSADLFHHRGFHNCETGTAFLLGM